MSILRSRDTEQTTVRHLQAEAREDYQRHHSPESQAACREQRGQAQVDGNAAAGSWHGHKQQK